jgi:hypothetical protein
MKFRWWSTRDRGATKEDVQMIVVQAKEEIMATLQDIIDAAQKTDDTVEAAAARVSADIAALKQQIEDLLAGGGFTPEQQAQIDAVAAKLDEVTLEAEAIDPTP